MPIHEHSQETRRAGHDPHEVGLLLDAGYIETNALFNVAIQNHDDIDRYDLIDPDTHHRVLWTPKSDEAATALVSKVLGVPNHPILPNKVSVIDDDEPTEGEFYELKPGVRLLSNILESSPYIDEYMIKLQKLGDRFIKLLGTLDRNRFGLDVDDIIVNHNGSNEDDIYLSIAPPLKPMSGTSMLDELQIARLTRILESDPDGMPQLNEEARTNVRW